LNDDATLAGRLDFCDIWMQNPLPNSKALPFTFQGQCVFLNFQLLDGIMDDLSQHAAKPVRERKWLINLWVWDQNYQSF